jgi:hypothetical protein
MQADGMRVLQVRSLRQKSLSSPAMGCRAFPASGSRPPLRASTLCHAWARPGGDLGGHTGGCPDDRHLDPQARPAPLLVHEGGRGAARLMRSEHVAYPPTGVLADLP